MKFFNLNNKYNNFSHNLNLNIHDQTGIRSLDRILNNNICFVDNVATQTGDTQNDTPSQDTPNDNNNNNLISVTKDELKELVNSAVREATKTNNNNNNVSFTDKQKEEQEKAEQEKNNITNLSSNIEFKLNLDSFINDNQKFFNSDLKNLVADIKKHETKDEQRQINLIKSAFAKQYFLNESNLKNLIDSDQKEVKEKILSKHYETDIDPALAFDKLTRALHINKHQENKQNISSFLGINGDEKITGYQNVDKHLKNIYPDRVVQTVNNK